MINNAFMDWDESTYHKLISLKPNDLISAKVRKGKRNNCDRILKLKIME
jgi:hypothetical protein